MPGNFCSGGEIYRVRSRLDKPLPGETRVVFQSRREIEEFFHQVGGNANEASRVREISQALRPRYSSRGRRLPARRSASSSGDPLVTLYDALQRGDAQLVLERPSLSVASVCSTTNDTESALDRWGDFINDAVETIKERAARIRNADYHILEQTFRFEPGSMYAPTLADPSSVRSHTTGWQSWDNKFEIAMFGVLKGLVAFRASQFLGLGNSSFATGLLAGQAELHTMQYRANGKSILRKRWYGSYGMRFNLRTFEWEIPWVEFSGCGAAERVLVELTRQDRALAGDRVIFTGQELVAGGFMRIDEFLEVNARGPQLPEYSTRQTIRG